MKQVKRIVAAVVVLGGLVLGLTGAASAARGVKPPVPDFTQAGKLIAAAGDFKLWKDVIHDWNLGPTGARGWVYAWDGQTAEARQILVTAVAKDSPADGVLRAGDVILGVGVRPFDGDARIQFARGIAAAETEAGGGKLRLIRWRGTQTSNVELKLAVLGSYSDTAPYDCEKSKRIFELGCRAIAKKGLDSVSIPNDLNALALLASGNKEYHPLLAEYARKVAVLEVRTMSSWHYAYAALFLGEYVVATQDQQVMEGLRRLATEIAAGQSAMGTWGHHCFTENGRCPAYGAMNQVGIVLTIAMIVAREAGVKDPGVDRAIARSASFLRWYVDKGAIPYGDHPPWPEHESNGKCSSTAVMFDLLGDREAAAFFAKMSTAGYDEREQGHTGNFFNVLWALPGVSRCGPLATGAYMKEEAWYYDLARAGDGSFGYQGTTEPREDRGKYKEFDCTGAYMLAYALPLRSLYITGKKPCSVAALDAGQVKDVIDAGRDYYAARKGKGYQGHRTVPLWAGLSSWSPAVRLRSAQALGRHEGRFVPRLLKMLASSDRYTRYGACVALGCLGPRADAAAPQLRALLNDSDPWMQSLACQAIPALGSKARQDSVADLLRMTVRQNPADPRRTTQRAASMALFSPYPGAKDSSPKSILAESLEGVDRKLLYPAIQSILENDDSVARASIGVTYGELTDHDLVALLPAIIKAIDQLAPSNVMFGDNIRLAGLDLVSRLHIREGMSLCVSVIEPDRWGAGRRLKTCMEYLSRYGAHAKEVLPQLRQVRQGFTEAWRTKDNDEFPRAVDKAIADIEASTALPTLLDLKEFTARR